MISLNSKICNSSLLICLKNSKCGFKTTTDCVKSAITPKETNLKGEISSYSNLVQHFSFGTFSSNQVDIRRRILFKDQLSVHPIILRCFSTDEKSPRKNDAIKSPSKEKSKPKTQLKKIDDDSVINQILLDKYRVPEPTTTAEKVKEGVKDVYYFLAFAGAVAVAGALLFVIFREFFSSKSPTSIFGRALDIVKANFEVEEALGTPIKGYGEESGRRRRRNVNHAEYIKDGVKFMRLKFYVEGPKGKGTVRLEVKENELGKYDFRYILVELDSYPMKTIIVIDDR